MKKLLLFITIILCMGCVSYAQKAVPLPPSGLDGTKPYTNEYLKTYVLNNGIMFEYNKLDSENKGSSIGDVKQIENLESVSFDLNVDYAENTTLEIGYTNSQDQRYKISVPLKTQKITIKADDFVHWYDWVRPAYEVKKNDEIGGFGILLNGNNAKAKFSITNFTIKAKTFSYEMFNFNKKPMPFTPSLKYPNNVKNAFQNDNTHRVLLAGSFGIFNLDNWDKSLDMLNEEFKGHFGMHVACANMPINAKYVVDLNKKGIKTTYEGHVGIWEYSNYYLTKDTYLYGSNGQTQFSFTSPPYQTQDISDVNFIDCMKDYIAQIASLGYSDYLLIDYVWPYFGGPVWLSDSMINSMKKDLSGTDAGIYLANDDAKYTKHSFWDYLNVFTDVKISPKDIKINSWNEYDPLNKLDENSREARIASFLFTALYHYEYIKFMNVMGEYAYTKNITMAASLNPEDILNGGDMYLLANTRGVGKIGHEFFGFPLQTNIWYNNMRRYSTMYTNNKKDFSLIGEINAGGHGASRYDYFTAYAFYYDATMTARPVDYNNQYLENPAWFFIDKKDTYNYGRFLHWYGGAKAYMQAFDDYNDYQPKRSTILVASKGGMEVQDGFTGSFGQLGNIGNQLNSLRYPFEAIGKEYFSDYIKDAKTVVYCPSQSSPMHLKNIKNWINTGTNKTLITHSFVPYSIFNGELFWDRQIHMITEPSDTYEKSINDEVKTAIVSLDKISYNIPIIINGISGNANIYVSKNTKTLLEYNNIPIISELTTKTGNKIIYINANVSADNELSREIINAAMKLANQKQETSADINCGVHLYDVIGGKSLVVWNNKIVSDQASANYYQRTSLKNNEPVTVKNLKPNNNYIVYDLFNNKDMTIKTDANGNLRIDVSDSVDVFYIGEDNKEFTTTLEKAKKTRESLAKYQ